MPEMTFSISKSNFQKHQVRRRLFTHNTYTSMQLDDRFHFLLVDRIYGDAKDGNLESS